VNAEDLRTTTAPGSWPVRRKVAHVMGMPISLALRGRHVDDDRAESAWQDALAILGEVDRVFSTYRHDSVISRLDRGEIDMEDCPPEVIEVLDLAERARIESGGAFDVRRPGPDGHLVLDPSGVVKGWAVERAARALETLPATDFSLSAGGDMVCRTKLPTAPPWRIGIEDPHDPQRVVAVVPVSNGAVATSGLAHRGAHIIDARSGRTPSGIASVTVVGPDLVSADIDATSAFALGMGALTWLRSRADRSGLVVWADGTSEIFGPSPVPGTSRR
jgi:thiamine biosynthesis lipoprotein